MNSKSILMALALVLTISSAAQAYLVPGNGHTDSGKPSNDPGRPGQYYPPPGQGGGHNGGGGYYPPPNNGGGGYYPPPNNGGGGYYPPPPHHQPPPPNYYPPTPPPYYPPQPPPSYGQRIVKQVYVGRSVENEMFQLSYYADLSTRYYGWEVTAVRASTRPNSPYRTTVQLIAQDRNVLATQINPGYQITLFPNSYVVAGTQELYLYVEGSTYIDTIEVELLQR